MMGIYEDRSISLVLLFLLFALSVFSGFYLTQPHGGSKNILGILNSSTEVNKQDIQTAEKDAFSAIKRIDEDIFSIFKSNISRDFSAAGGFYRVETNDKGLREENFRAVPPENVERIIFVGDSYTFGWGVPVEDRYVDIVEERLNSNLPDNYETIAAAVPGWGMSDYRRYIFHRGIHYQPDIVVVAFNQNDIISREEEIEIYNNVTESTPENTSIRIITQKVGKIKAERIRNTDLRESGFLDDMENITSVVEKNGSKVIFYAYFPLPRDKRAVIENWASKHNATFVPAPRKFTTLPHTYYSLSQHDRHYNKQGHTILADKIYSRLENLFSEGKSGFNLGF